MSDNVSQMHTPQGKKLLRRIVLFALILLLVLGGCALYIFRDSINTDAMRRYFKYLNVTETDSAGHFSFDAHSGNRYAGLGDGLALASVSGVTVLDANGATGQSALPREAFFRASRQALQRCGSFWKPRSA